MFMALLLVAIFFFWFCSTIIEHNFSVSHQRSKHEVKTGIFESIPSESEFEQIIKNSLTHDD